MQDGRIVQLKRPKNVPCAGGSYRAVPFKGKRGAHAKDDAPNHYAVWPESASARVQPLLAEPLAAATLPEREHKEALRAASAMLVETAKIERDLKSWVGRPFCLTAVFSADLDGDGQPDRFYDGTFVTDSDDPTSTTLSGVLVRLAKKPVPILPIEQATLGSSHPVATLDLDGNGRIELLWSSSYYEGDGAYVNQWSGTELIRLGTWDCGL